MAVPYEDGVRVRILVVGDADVGKTTLIRTLCSVNTGGHASSIGSHPAQTYVDLAPTVGCTVSLRVGENGLVEEFYDVGGGERWTGRSLFYRSIAYDGVMLVHDVSDGGSSRASVSRIWAPETMNVLGDAKGVESGGRRRGDGPHVRVRGALNEILGLWRDVRSGYAGVCEAGKEAAWVFLRLVRLVLNESGVWTDMGIDQAVESEMVATSSVPVAVVGLKADMAGGSGVADFADRVGNVMEMSLISFDAWADNGVNAFLRRSGELAIRRRFGTSTPTGGAHSELSGASVTLPLI